MSYDVQKRSTREFLADWAAIMRELRRRDVIRTNNNPIGDIAEALVAAHFGGQRGSFSQAGWDVITPAGERIQVKALRVASNSRTRRNLSPIRDRDYDTVVIVVFDEDFQVTEALQVSRETVEALFPVRPHVNGRVIRLTRAFRAHPDVHVLDVTDVILDTAAPVAPPVEGRT